MNISERFVIKFFGFNPAIEALIVREEFHTKKKTRGTTKLKKNRHLDFEL